MANKTIGQLTAKTTPSSADVFALEDTEDTKKINYDALADAILNKITSKNYTVAGSSQTLINAINTLNSKMAKEAITVGSGSAITDCNDCNDLYKVYVIQSGASNSPGEFFMLYPLKNSWGSFQLAIRFDGSYVKIRSRTYSAGWGEWVQQPTRAEITALNSNTYSLLSGTEVTANADLNTFTTPGNYYCKTNATAATLSNCPITSGFIMKVEYGLGTGTPRQTLRAYDSNDIWSRTSTTAAWVKMPTRAEVDALNATLVVKVSLTNVTITDNGNTTISVSSYRPSGYGLYAANVLLKQSSGSTYYQLPWLDLPSGTSLNVYSLTNDTVVIKNVGSGWGACDLWLTLIYCK